MKLIFRISAGIVIGLLAYQVILMKMYPPDYYEDLNAELQEVENLKGKVIVLQVAVHNYFDDNKKLPAEIGEIKCFRWLDGRTLRDPRKQVDIPCAEAVMDGVFYVNYKHHWTAIEPYLINNSIRFKCSTTQKFVGDERYSHCKEIDADDVIGLLASKKTKINEGIKGASDSRRTVHAIGLPEVLNGEWVGEFSITEKVGIGDDANIRRIILNIFDSAADVELVDYAGNKYLLGQRIKVHRVGSSFTLNSYQLENNHSEMWTINVADFGEERLKMVVTRIKKWKSTSGVLEGVDRAVGDVIKLRADKRVM